MSKSINLKKKCRVYRWGSASLPTAVYTNPGHLIKLLKNCISENESRNKNPPKIDPRKKSPILGKKNPDYIITHMKKIYINFLQICILSILYLSLKTLI